MNYNVVLCCLSTGDIITAASVELALVIYIVHIVASSSTYLLSCEGKDYRRGNCSVFDAIILARVLYESPV